MLRRREWPTVGWRSCGDLMLAADVAVNGSTVRRVGESFIRLAVLTVQLGWRLVIVVRELVWMLVGEATSVEGALNLVRRTGRSMCLMGTALRLTGVRGRRGSEKDSIRGRVRGCWKGLWESESELVLEREGELVREGSGT